MEEIDNNELKFRMITPDGESFLVNSAPIEGWQNDIWKTFDEQKRVFDAEIKKHLNTVTYRWRKQLNGLN